MLRDNPSQFAAHVRRSMQASAGKDVLHTALFCSVVERCRPAVLLSRFPNERCVCFCAGGVRWE